MWFGTERGGLHRLTTATNEPVLLENGKTLKRIGSLGLDSTRRLWVGTQEGGLYYVDKKTLRYAGLFSSNRRISALLEDDRWGLWVGAGKPAELYRIVGDAPRKFPLPGDVSSMDVSVFAADGEGGLWFGTRGEGLFHWNGRDYAHYDRKNGVKSDVITALLWDETEQCLWVGTVGGGLSRLKGERIDTYGLEQGLHDDTIHQILDDRFGWLWCASAHGVFRVSKSHLNDLFANRTNAVISIPYGLSDGLPSLECAVNSQPGGCRSSDGRLWWPTAKGLAWVNPAAIPTNAIPPRVFLDGLVVDGRAVEIPQTASSGSPVILAPGIHQVDFEFSALSWPMPEFVRFRYCLEGADERWIDAVRERAAHYNGLKAGNYVFRVTGVSRDGVWSAAPACVAVQIKPFFWQTWWFETCVVCLLAGGVGIAVLVTARRRHRRRIETLERLRALEQERVRIAQDIHDDLGASLTQIALLSELARGELQKPEAARDYLDRIFTCARKLARSTDEIVWALHSKNNTVELSLDFITHYAQEFLKNTGVRCRLDMPAELPDLTLPSTTRHHLFLAVKEALGNVVKHASATEVWLRLTCSGNRLVLTIEDNGTGIAPLPAQDSPGSRKVRRQGNGMQNMRQRMESVGGHFECVSQPGQGTLIRLTVALEIKE
jgi:signal transduction histidine kinase